MADSVIARREARGSARGCHILLAMRRLWPAALLLAACTDIAYRDCSVQCSTSGRCPMDTACVGGYCLRPGTPACGAPGADAAVDDAFSPEDDAPVPSELVRAFAWTARTSGNAACPREAVGECAALIRRMGLAEAFAPELETLHGKAVAAPSTGRIIDCETEFNFDDDFRYAYETRYQVRARENIA